MRRDCRPIALLALAGIFVLTATGCPDSDVLNTGNFEVTFETATINDESWVCVLMNITQLVLKPVDGTCAGGTRSGDPCLTNIDCGGGICEGSLSLDSIDTGKIEALIDPGLQLASFSEQGVPCEQFPDSGSDFPLQILSAGRYKITVMRIGRPTLVDAQGTVKRCAGFSGDLADVAAFQDALFFTVGQDEPNRVRFTMDADALAPLLDAPDCNQAITGAGIGSFLEIG